MALVAMCVCVCGMSLLCGREKAGLLYVSAGVEMKDTSGMNRGGH